jgi:hypothetical protein
VTAPRLRLSESALTVVLGEADPGRPCLPALRELAAAGALVRRTDGALVVDPALSAAARAWRVAPVRLEVVVRRAGSVVRAAGALAPPLAVCVVRTSGDGDGPVAELAVPGPAGLVGELLAHVPDVERAADHQVREVPVERVPPELHGGGPGLWLRVRAPGWVGLDHAVHVGTGWLRIVPAGTRREPLLRLEPVARTAFTRALCGGIARALDAAGPRS